MSSTKFNTRTSLTKAKAPGSTTATSLPVDAGTPPAAGLELEASSVILALDTEALRTTSGLATDHTSGLRLSTSISLRFLLPRPVVERPLQFYSSFRET